MKKFIDVKPSTLSISDLYENNKFKKYNFKPACQRESDVWNDDDKSYLIDSILKNYPIPPIFLRPKTDGNSGRTTYDVIDGKQRLETIIQFIEGKIYVPEDFSDDPLFEGDKDLPKKIAGLTFPEILKRNDEFSEYIQQFWTYTLNVAVVNESNNKLVNKLFDRLNRNGEPLNSQELRNAQFHETELLKTITEIAEDSFWKEKLTKTSRMQNKEFISELLFSIISNSVISTEKEKLDSLYKKYSNKTDFEQEKKVMKKIEKTILSFQLDFEKMRRLLSPTHLYTIFSIALYCQNNNSVKKEKVKDFYIDYFVTYSDSNKILVEYKEAASNRTHSSESRNTRLNCVLEYCK